MDHYDEADDQIADSNQHVGKRHIIFDVCILESLVGIRAIKHQSCADITLQGEEYKTILKQLIS